MTSALGLLRDTGGAVEGEVGERSASSLYRLRRELGLDKGRDRREGREENDEVCEEEVDLEVCSSGSGDVFRPFEEERDER